MQNFDGRHQDITVVRSQSDFKKTGSRLATKFVRNAGLVKNKSVKRKKALLSTDCPADRE